MRRWSLLLFWLVSDLAIFAAMCVVAYFLRIGWIFSTEFPFDHYLTATVIAAPLWLGTLVVTRTFALTRPQGSLRSFAYLLYAGFVGIALLALIYYFLYKALFSRLLLVEAGALVTATIFVWHLLWEQIQRSILRRDPPVFPTLIVGVTRESTALIERLEKNRSPLKPVAILDARGVKEKDIAGVPVMGKLNKLEDIMRDMRITHVIQGSDLEQSINLLSACRAHGATYMLMPSVLGMVERDERIETLEGHPVTAVTTKEVWWTWFFR